MMCPACLVSVYPNNRVSNEHSCDHHDGGADDDVDSDNDQRLPKQQGEHCGHHCGGVDDDVEGADDGDDDVPCLSWQTIGRPLWP